MAEPKRSINIRVVATDDTPVTAGDHVLKATEKIGTNQMADPFAKQYGLQASIGLRILEPEVPLEQLAKLPLENGTLFACIDAMKTNIESFGYRLEYIGPEGKEPTAESQEERNWVTDILDRCNADESFTQVREKLRLDYETFGHGYAEVGRDGEDNPSFVYQIAAQTMRMTTAEDEDTEVDVWMRRGGKLVKMTAQKRFRRFVQIRRAGGEKVWFKEFGDPRRISSKTGKVDPNCPDDEEATEVIMLNRYTPGYAYGLPRYISVIAAILGCKESELVNLNFFKDNAIPAMAVLVAGGMLSEDAMDELRKKFDRRKGRDSINRILVLEARTPDEELPLDGSNPAVPKLDIKPLTQERQGDALFQDFEKNNQTKIRMCYKLPPLLIGLAEDYTRATSESSLDMAEAQVFGPERIVMDSLGNDKLLLREGKPLRFWKYASNPPRVASIDSKVAAIKQLNTTGGITPNITRNFLNELFGLRLPAVKEAWGDIPMDFTMQMVRNGRVQPETGLPETEYDQLGTSGGATNVPQARTRNIRVKPNNSDEGGKDGDAAK